MNEIEVHGIADAGYEQVRAEFAAVLADEDGESGAQPAAYVRGRSASPYGMCWCAGPGSSVSMVGSLSPSSPTSGSSPND